MVVAGVPFCYTGQGNHSALTRLAVGGLLTAILRGCFGGSAISVFNGVGEACHSAVGIRLVRR